MLFGSTLKGVRERVSGSEDIQTDTVATSETQQSTPIVRKNQWKQRSARLVRKEQTFPTRELEEPSEEAACSAAKRSQKQKEGETEIINEGPYP